jgi:hypothetical protein
MLTPSKERFLWLAVLSYAVLLEMASWITSTLPPCIVNPENYVDDHQCPAFHVFLIKHGTGILEGIGHNWVTALGTVAIAYFTLTIRNINRGQLEHGRQVERAYISVLAPQHQFLVHNDGSVYGVRLWVTWKNSGTTPATRVDTITGATWVPAIEQFEFGKAEEVNRQPFVLGPSAETASLPIGISGGHLSANLRGEGHQFLWGRARYRDIFANSPEHVVEFCFRVTFEGQLGPHPFLGRAIFAFYGEHNRYYDEPATE